MRSPQLTQSITALDEALQGGNYGAVVSNFGIDPSPGTAALVSHIVRRVCWTVLHILLYASFTSTVIFVNGFRRGDMFPHYLSFVGTMTLGLNAYGSRVVYKNQA